MHLFVKLKYKLKTKIMSGETLLIKLQITSKIVYLLFINM